MELQKIQDENLLWKLFKSTFIISAFTIGGGFVIIPLLKAKFVDEYKWLDDKEALNLVAIAQSAPGVVAANAAFRSDHFTAADYAEHYFLCLRCLCQ